MEGEKLEQLRETYRNLLDGELLSLAADAKSLTDVARFVLQEEIARRGLNERDLAKLSTHASEEYSEVPRQRNRSKLLFIFKNSGSVFIFILYGLNYAWTRFHHYPKRWMATASWFLILLCMVISAIFELRRIKKKERRRKRLATAFGLDKRK